MFVLDRFTVKHEGSHARTHARTHGKNVPNQATEMRVEFFKAMKVCVVIFWDLTP